MDEAEIRAYILAAYPDIGVTDLNGDSYFFTDPEKLHPFATLVTSDAHDNVSDLNRPGVYRLNIGVEKATFAELFASEPNDADHAAYDYTAFDRIMPHPVYGKLSWVCVLNPGQQTFTVVEQLLTEAYEAGVRRRSQAI